MKRSLPRPVSAWLPAGALVVTTLLAVACSSDGAGGRIDGGASDATDDAAAEGLAHDSEPGDVASAAGTWTDWETGLMWQATDFAALAWQEAIEYCDSLSLGGLDDWHLPDIGELRALIRGCPATTLGGTCNVTVSHCVDIACKGVSCAGCGAGNGSDAEGCYWPDGLSAGCVVVWSSTLAGDRAAAAWHVDFGDGSVDTAARTDANTVLCVRY